MNNFYHYSKIRHNWFFGDVDKHVYESEDGKVRNTRGEIVKDPFKPERPFRANRGAYPVSKGKKFF